MSLSIIGAGLGRTGTMSLRSALGQLGFPCYHMADVLFDPTRKSDVDFWLEVLEDPDRADRDWDRVFGHVTATVDYPGCAAWRGLLAAYPDAKVIFTTHPKGVEAWYDSTRSTIYTGTGLDAGSSFGQKVNTMMDGLIWNGLMQGTMDDRAAAIARHDEHLAEVRAAVPADRFLVYSVDQGWEPLCRFLDVPVPDTPFPQVNGREHMARVAERLKMMQRFARGRATE